MISSLWEDVPPRICYQGNSAVLVHLHDLTGSPVGHLSGYILKVFYLLLNIITFRGRSVQKQVCPKVALTQQQQQQQQQ